MDNEKKFNTLVMATFILSIAVLLLAIAVLVKDFIPTCNQPVVREQGKEQGQHQQPQVKISKSYDKHSISLDKAMLKNKPVAVFFYVDWCGFCQRFAPTYKELTKNRDLRKKYTFVYVNCEDPKNSMYVQQYGINSYPSLYLVNPANNDKARVANQLMFIPDAMTALQEQFDKFLISGSQAVTQPAKK